MKMLISIPDELCLRWRAAVPAGKRSAAIKELIEKEVLKKEQELYKTALAVEKDEALNQEMEIWDSTLNDGLDDESW